jgi:hypothetical protein
MAEFKKNDRVRLNHSKEGPMLGVIGKVSKAKGRVEFVPDGSFKLSGRTWGNAVYDVKTLVEIPGKFEIVTDPLPDECKLPDDPMVLAGFTAKVTGMCEANEGYAYNLKVLLRGKDTNIRFDEGGYGGKVEYDTRKADPKVVEEFEIACEAWNAHHGILGPHRGGVTPWEVWQGHMFELDAYRSFPANFPIALVATPEPWEWTFDEKQGAKETVAITA